MSRNEDVLVIGGGIGGLAAALAAAEAGNKTTVLEQAPQFGEIGAGIQMGPNAMAVLDRFGVGDEISKYAVFPKRLVLKDVYTAKELATLDLGDEFKAKFGFPYMVLHRSDLHRVMFEACEKNPLISLVHGQTIETVEETEAGVTVKNNNGEQFTGKAVIGADGLKSKTRKYFSDDEPICSHYVAYRGTIHISEISSEANMDDVIMWIGPNLHVVQYPVRRGELYNQVVVFKSSNFKEGSDYWGTPEEMDERFKGCHPQLETAIPRTAKVQTSARTWGEIIHAENPVSILLRNTLLESREAKEFEMIDWLYGYKKVPGKVDC